MCDRCADYLAEIEALRDELHDLKTEQTRKASVAQAAARAGHPSAQDWCPPHGIVRPLHLVPSIAAAGCSPTPATTAAVERDAPPSATAPAAEELS